MNERPVKLEREGPAAFLTLNRPHRRNALTLEMLTGIREGLAEISADLDISAVVIRSEGPVFSSGHDLKELQEADDAGLEEIFQSCTAMMEFIQEMPQPVIAQVQGLATAAGLQLVAACDLAVAAETAGFAAPGVRIGFFCSTPMVPLSRVVGRKKALEMLLTGETITAAEAFRYGLVNRVVPPEELDGAVRELLGTLTGFSRRVLTGGKRAFYGQLELSQKEAYQTASGAMIQGAGRPEAVEGISAFLEKREPRWKD
jgi:enoyl-CoA hydratase/carnithine racemase